MIGQSKDYFILYGGDIIFGIISFSIINHIEDSGSDLKRHVVNQKQKLENNFLKKMVTKTRNHLFCITKSEHK